MAEDPGSARPAPAAPASAADARPPAPNGAGAERRSDQRFRAIFDSMFQFIGLMEPDGTLIEANRTALDFGGLRPEDVLGKKFWDCHWWQVSEEAQERLKAAVAHAARGEFVRYEADVLGAGGRVATIDFSIKPVHGDDGRVDLLIPEGRVITEAVQARRMQEGLTVAQVGTFELDLATQAVHRSTSTDGTFGFTSNDAPRDLDAYLERVHPEDLPLALNAIRRAVEEGGEQFATFRLLLPDGRVRWVAARGVVLPGVRGGSPRLVGAIMDVTEQRTAEQERRREDEQRHAALEAARLGTWDYDLDGGGVHLDARGREVFDLRRDVHPIEEALGRIHPEDRPAVERALQAAVGPPAGGRIDVEYRVLRPSGEERWVRATGSTLYEGEGKARRPVRLVGVVMDETERRAAEQRLHESAARLRVALDAAEMGTWSWDLATGRLQADAQECALLGEPPGAFPTMEAFFARVHPDDLPGLQRRLDEAFASAGEYDYEFRARHADGSYRWLAGRGREARDERGSVRVFGVNFDVTARKEAERAQALLAGIVASSDDAIASKTLDGTITSWNAGAERVFGYTAEEAVGRPVLMLIPPERRDEEDHILGRIRRGERVEHYETVRVRKDGQLIDVSVAVSPLRDGAGRVVGASNVTRDVTAQKRAEAALRESEGRFRALFSESLDAILLADDAGTYVDANPAACELLGYAREELLGKTIADLSEVDEEAFRAMWAAFLQEGRMGGEFRLRTRQGDPLDVEFNAVANVVPGQHLSSLRDVTERKRAEEALRQSEERFRLAVSAVAGMVYDWDVATGEVFRTEGLHALIGVRPEAVPPERTWWADRVHPDDTARVFDLIRTVIESDADDYSVEYRVRHEDGRWVHLWDRGHIVRDADGRAVRVVGSSADVSDRKRAEAALRESEARFRTLADSAPVLIWLTDEENRGTYFNWQWLDFTGRALEDALGLGWLEDVHPDDRGAAAAYCQRHFDAREPFRMEFRLRRADGPYRWVLDHGIPRFTPDGQFLGYIGSCVDIHDRKEAEQGLRLYREVFANSVEGVAIIGLDGHYMEQNAAHRAMTGYDDADLEGRTPALHLGEGAFAEIAAALAADGHWQGEATSRAKSGEEKAVELSAFTVYDAEGAPACYVGIKRDVTERKAAETRARLLAETGRLVEQALDYEGALREIARVVVPGFADWCAVDLLHEDGSISAVAIAHVDPEKVRWGWALREREPIDPEAPTGVPNVVRTGEPEVYPVITDEMLVAGARDEEHLRLLREIGFSSIVTVPMRAGDEVVGAITFVQTESGRHFDEADLTVAMEIGRRAGATIETARLHRALQESEGRFRAISALTSDFAYAARPNAEGVFEREWVSGAYERITGYEPDEVGEVDPWRRLVHPEDVAEGEAHLEALLSGRASVSEHRLVTKAGEVRWVRDYARPERDADGRLVRVIGAVQDITEQKEAEQALREREARLQAVIDTALDGIITIDERGTVETINPAAVRIFGYAPEEVVGRNVRMLMPEPYHSEHDGYIAHYLETGERRIIGSGREVEGRRKDGTTFPMELAVSETHLDGRRLFTGLVRDITERKAAEAALRESEARFRQLAEALPQIVYTLPADGRRDTEYLNAQWYVYTGMPPGTSYSDAAPEVVHPDDRARGAEARAEAGAAGTQMEMELRLRRHDGQYRWFLTRLVPIKDADGRITRWFGTSTDIHEQKEAEAALAAAVAERTRELERSNRELDQFAYVASHDLKGPLRGIDNLATWIREDAGPLLPEASQRHLALLHGRVQRLEALLDSLLAYSRAGRLTGLAEDVDAGALVREVAELLDHPEAVTFEVADDLPALTTYRAPLELVFRNLLSNAVKHAGRPDPTVRVTASEGGAPEGFVTFAVADDGPGIPAAYHDRIFGLFQTLRPRDEVEGSGMGLAVVKKTVESLGGAIRVESAPGEGTTFYFTWPRRIGA